MIEVLVTMIIIAVGLLGLAALQSKAQQAELESYQRTQAVILLQDMVDRIYANRGTAGCYAITTDPATGTPYAGTGSGTFTCNSFGTTATQLVADGDLLAWSEALKGMEGTGGTLIGGRGCITYDIPNDLYTVAVAWQGLSSTTAPADSCATGLYGDADKRRVVTATVRIGNLN